MFVWVAIALACLFSVALAFAAAPRFVTRRFLSASSAWCFLFCGVAVARSLSQLVLCRFLPRPCCASDLRVGHCGLHLLVVLAACCHLGCLFFLSHLHMWHVLAVCADPFLHHATICTWRAPQSLGSLRVPLLCRSSRKQCTSCTFRLLHHARWCALAHVHRVPSRGNLSASVRGARFACAPHASLRCAALRVFFGHRILVRPGPRASRCTSRVAPGAAGWGDVSRFFLASQRTSLTEKCGECSFAAFAVAFLPLLWPLCRS